MIQYNAPLNYSKLDHLNLNHPTRVTRASIIWSRSSDPRLPELRLSETSIVRLRLPDPLLPKTRLSNLDYPSFDYPTGFTLLMLGFLNPLQNSHHKRLDFFELIVYNIIRNIYTLLENVKSPSISSFVFYWMTLSKINTC